MLSDTPEVYKSPKAYKKLSQEMKKTDLFHMQFEFVFIIETKQNSSWSLKISSINKNIIILTPRSIPLSVSRYPSKATKESVLLSQDCMNDIMQKETPKDMLKT